MSETACLIGVRSPQRRKYEAEESFEELIALADTAGLSVVHQEMAEVRYIKPATYLGSGTMARITTALNTLKPSVVIIDVDLTGTQNRNLEEFWKISVVDRTSLILDIFAQHAKSREGKLQVELAQYEYLYPRLVGAWTHLSKQRGGGVGLRGPGETQLEVDRRRARERMAGLREALQKVSVSRDIHRRKRAGVPIPTVTLVGYTNAGKSTLFNALTSGAQIEADKLFATLDPKTTKIKLPSRREILLADTVGFIRNLPHPLIEAFKSTFEEARGSDLLLHVVDVSHPYYRHQMEVVDGVLHELDLDKIPQLKVMNKIDVPSATFIGNGDMYAKISAKTGAGLNELLQRIDEVLADYLKPIILLIPHSAGQDLAQLHSLGHIHRKEIQENGVWLEVSLPDRWLKQFSQYRIFPLP